jgi:pSer/pThr/pTyr-binding forkhead associated (FHA) protein
MASSELDVGDSTATYRIDESGVIEEIDLERIAQRGATLVIRFGGGRAGEAFLLDRSRLTVGRRPDSDVFLDDVTVSRDHAVVVKRGDHHFIDDCGSLNGTYVNRRRIDSVQLDDGDELQIGKYKLAFLGH